VQCLAWQVVNCCWWCYTSDTDQTELLHSCEIYPSPTRTNHRTRPSPTDSNRLWHYGSFCFCQGYDTSFWSLHLHQFSLTWHEHVNRHPAHNLCQNLVLFSSIKGRFSPKQQKQKCFGHALSAKATAWVSFWATGFILSGTRHIFNGTRQMAALLLQRFLQALELRAEPQICLWMRYFHVSKEFCGIW